MDSHLPPLRCSDLDRTDHRSHQEQSRRSAATSDDGSRHSCDDALRGAPRAEMLPPGTSITR